MHRMTPRPDGGACVVEMVLVDWTRMGTSYCLAGAILDGNSVQVVRPILSRYRTSPVRNAGWSPYLLDGHARWEIFELVGATQADTMPPHLEDIWVRSLRPHKCLAAPEQRRSIL